jgi:hypothetical protein
MLDGTMLSRNVTWMAFNILYDFSFHLEMKMAAWSITLSDWLNF